MTSRISPDLLDAMVVVEVSRAEQFAAMTEKVSKGLNGGFISYKLRESRRAADVRGTLSTIGDTQLGGGLSLSAVSESLGTYIDFIGEHPEGLCIMSVLSGSVAFRRSRTDKYDVCVTGSVGLFEVGPESRGISEDGSSRLNLWVARSRLHRRLEATLERSLPAPLRFAPERRWPVGVASSLRRLLAYAAAEVEDPYSLLAGGVGAAEFQDLVTRTLLGGVPHNYTDSLNGPRAPEGPLVYRRALEYMRAHLHEPLTMTMIAEQVGCSPRALAEAARLHAGCKIATMLQRMRLDAAHADLSRGHTLSVAAVARRYQFSNPGRFSRHYRARFGASPGRRERRRGAP